MKRNKAKFREHFLRENAKISQNVLFNVFKSINIFWVNPSIGLADKSLLEN